MSTAPASLSETEALALAAREDLEGLMGEARALRDAGFGERLTYSPKVFIPLTRLCRDTCSYCTFARGPGEVEAPFLTIEQVLAIAREGERHGCTEALFTLGDQPERRYRAAREALRRLGFGSTLDYLHTAAAAVLEHTSLLPHLNPGVLDHAAAERLREVSVSLGLMLESSAARLAERGGPHHAAPDKHPAARIASLEATGAAGVPTTTGILIGIGETRRERVESLLAIRRLHERYGHIQEVIIQNFRAKPRTGMARAEEPELAEHLWSIAVARLVLGPELSLQAPPNLQPAALERLVDAGINDWGGISAVTPDHVNPEAPWPAVASVEQAGASRGKHLAPRLPVYPRFLAAAPGRWLSEPLHRRALAAADADLLARAEAWSPGEPDVPPPTLRLEAPAVRADSPFAPILAAARRGERLSEAQITALFAARGEALAHVATAADELRAETVGETVTYAVNRNINYTNVCYFKCQFCAFSKGRLAENLRGLPYVVEEAEISRRTQEAWERGAGEVCLQGGIHPAFTGQTYLDILATVKAAVPAIHVHAFSPLEVWQGAQTLDLPLEAFLGRLRDGGLGSLPGTAAEILDDEVRATLCPDKLRTGEWLRVMASAHALGLRSTATIMFGHMERPWHWARHLLAIRDLQARTGGFTELVPLPFVAREAPMYRKGRARRGPTFREVVLMHAVARLALHPLIPNIQTSWVKLGREGVAACLRAGANDLGGTLMNESISRAAGAAHGQEMAPAVMDALITGLGRAPRIRSTLYGHPDPGQVQRAYRAGELAPVAERTARDYLRTASA